MRRIKFNFSEHNQSIEDIYDYYTFVKEAILLKYSPDNPNYLLDFNFMSSSEILTARNDDLDELSNEASISLYSCIEAMFRIDFISRCHLKKKDKLSRIYRSTYNASKRIYQYSYVDVVLKGWKQYKPEREILLNRLISATDFRNWLAHGRYWKFKDNLAKYTFDSNYRLAKDIETNFPDLLKVEMFEKVI